MEASTLDSDTVPPQTREGPAPRPARSLRPRRARLAFSLSRGTLGVVALLAGAGLSGAFVLGFVLGQQRGARTPEEPPAEARVVLEPVRLRAAMEAAPREPRVPAAPAPAVVEPVPTVEPAPAVASPPAPKLELRRTPPAGRGLYGIQLGAYPEEAQALALLEAHARELAPHPVHLLEAQIKDKGTWHRVRVGVFRSKAEAEAARRRLSPQLEAGALVVSYR